jgi:hypothetical protein
MKIVLRRLRMKVRTVKFNLSRFCVSAQPRAVSIESNALLNPDTREDFDNEILTSILFFA